MKSRHLCLCYINGIAITQSYNELSARYRVLPTDFSVPDLDQITTQFKGSNQMRTDEQNEFTKEIEETMYEQNTTAFQSYKKVT